MKIRDWKAEWRELYPVDEQTAKHDLQMVSGFVDEYGEREIDDFSRIMALRWHKSNPASSRFLKTFFYCAIDAGLCDQNPFAGLDIKSRGNKDLKVITAERVWDLANAALTIHSGELGRQVRGQILLGSFAAMRICEISRLEATSFERLDVPVPGLYATVTPKEVAGDGAKPRVVPILPLIRPDVEAVIPDVGLLWATSTGLQHDRRSVHRLFKPVREHVGLEETTFHHLRHFGTTWLIEQGIDESAVSWFVHGHPRAKEVRERYAHPERDNALLRVMEAVR